MNLRTLSLGLLALLLIAALPMWQGAQGWWGYLPSGMFAALFATVVLLYLTRRI